MKKFRELVAAINASPERRARVDAIKAGMMMEEYDDTRFASYVKLADRPSARQLARACESVVFDYDADGKLVGIEFLWQTGSASSGNTTIKMDIRGVGVGHTALDSLRRTPEAGI